MEPIQAGYGLMKKAFEICQLIEKLPPSTEQTNTVSAMTDLLRDLSEKFAWRSFKDNGYPAIARPVWLRLQPAEKMPSVAILCMYRGEGYWQELHVWDDKRKTEHVKYPNATHWVYADCPEIPSL